MTQETFIQKAMIALLANPNVTDNDNYDSNSHYKFLYNMLESKVNMLELAFDDVNSAEADTYPDAISTKGILHTIAESLQVIAGKVDIENHRKETDGNLI